MDDASDAAPGPAKRLFRNRIPRRHRHDSVMKTTRLLLAFAAVTLGALSLQAQPARVSGSEITSMNIDGNRVTLAYGRPYSKDPKTGEARKIWGGLVPFGKVWRTGANEATLLITQHPIQLGDVVVPAGAYSLFTLPKEDGSAELIVNRQIGHWGTQYDERQDLARVPLVRETLPQPVDQFTMRVERNPAGGGLIRMQWETTQYSVAYTVKK